MITPADVARWTDEAAPALRGGRVHRVWRDGGVWVVLVRHHAGGDPEARAVRRVALEADLSPEGLRCVAVTPERVAADDDRAKKDRARDAHPFLSQLRKGLGGGRVEEVAAVPGDRIVLVDVAHDAPDFEGPRRRRLVVELMSRGGNLILCRLDPESEAPICEGALEAGRAARPFDAGARYRTPPPREAAAEAAPTVAVDVAPDPEALALGEAASAELGAAAEAAQQASRRGQLRKGIRQGTKRLEGVLGKLEQQLAEVARADDYERRGDLIKANLERIPKQADRVTVVDYAAGGEEVELELDPTEPAVDQMKALYKRAKKLRSGEAAVQLRLGETDAKLEDARALAAELEDLDDPEDEAALDRVEDRARRLGLLPKKKPPKRKEQPNLGPRSYRTREGHEVLVGRSDEENDRLTMRIARGRDLFFHVRGCPGSHVILRVDPQRPPNHESLLDAAALAVHYSKARNRGAVDVSYTPRKWVKKPRGAKPGLVQISNEKTVRAGGDPERLRRVLDTLRRPGEE